MNEYNKSLKEITNIFLKNTADYGELYKAANDLYELLISVSKLEPDDKVSRDEIYLPNGKAIGPVWAAMCVKEFMRTKQFISGIFKAVKDAKKRFQNEKLHILYAGTGPFATLILPLTTYFTSEEVQFTLLEINSHSIDCLKNTIKTFEIEEYIKDIICCDATKFKADKSSKIHMIISETMLNALQKEPQVAITMNLAPQMTEEGIFVPQNVTIEAGLLNPKRVTERMMGINTSSEDHIYIIKKIFELNKDINSLEHYYDIETKNTIFENKEVEIPENISKAYSELCLLTTIQVYDDEYLTNWQCSLNLPKKILDLNNQKSPIKKVDFRYVISTKPEFKWDTSSFI